MTSTQRSPDEPGSIAKRLGGHPQFTAIATLSDVRTQFVDAMAAAGIVPTDPGQIIADGLVHRFRCDGDKSGSHNGWCVLHLDGIPAGAFGNWRGSIQDTWHAGHGPVTAIQREQFREQIEAAKRQRQAEIPSHQAAAQQHARELWREAAQPDPGHAYLKRKHVKAHGIRQLNTLLLVPMRDGDGELRSLQTIDGEGRKRFLTGGRKRGLYFAMGKVTDELLIAEGYATGASLFETTGKPVAVAFDCGNLEAVARILRAKFPRVHVTLCADNDVHTEGNPGLTHANAAASAVGGSVAIPPRGFNDFNDAAMAACEVTA